MLTLSIDQVYKVSKQTEYMCYHNIVFNILKLVLLIILTVTIQKVDLKLIDKRYTTTISKQEM